MSNSDSGGCLSVIMIIGTVASWLGSGIIAWDWVEPESFGTAILFLIAWAFLGKVFDFIFGLIIVGIASILN